MFLVTPLPRALRKKVLTVLHTSALLARVTYTLRFTYVFILILFVDSVNRVYRVQIEASNMMESPHSQYVASDRSEVQSRKFYAQRNMYLCGFTLFLSLILNRTYVLVVDLMNMEDRLGDKAPVTEHTNGSDKAEIERLEKLVKQKEVDLETMRKQASALSREYMDVADKVNENETTNQDKKND